MKRDDFPFRVGIAVARGDAFEPREVRFDGTSHHVRLEEGEVYAVQIATKHDRVAFLRLLVDGLNTLPDCPAYNEKGIDIEPVERSDRPVRRQAQRVNLSEAIAWALHPPEKAGQWRAYQVSGFFSRADAQGQYNAFEVTDAAGSEASRQGYTDQVGAITAAFYEGVKPPPGGSRGGTRLGQRYQTHVEQYQGDLIPGPLLGVIHIHYGK